MQHLPPTPDKRAINAQAAHARAGTLGITKSDKVARGCARRITNLSKEPQQKGGLKGGLITK